MGEYASLDNFIREWTAEENKRQAHPFRGVLGGAKHNGLRHTVSAFQILGDFFRNLPDAVFQDDVIVIIAVVVNAVGNFIAKYVQLTFAGPPAVRNINLKNSLPEISLTW